MKQSNRKNLHAVTWRQQTTKTIRQFCVKFRLLGILLVVFSHTMRLGEASNPGPHFGCMNPTGLMGKGNVVSQLPASSVWAVQETHLTATGISRFKQELKWNDSDLKIVHGAPAPPKTEGLHTIGGKHTGVCFLSNFPCRAIAHDWKPDEFATSRVQTAASFVNGHWINMGTAYGYANSCSIEMQQQTDNLLTGLTSRIVEGSSGKRIISGDWNITRDCLVQADYWESLGWMEIQEVAKMKWGWVPQATCKKTTIKDYMYVSPELIPLISNVSVDWSFFPDHAVVMFEVDNMGTPPKVPMWRKPLPMNLEKLHDLQDMSFDSFDIKNFQDLSSDQQYSLVFQTFENSVDSELTKKGKPKLHPAQKGRAMTKEVRTQVVNHAPIRPNRKGDIQTEVVSSSLNFTRWTRQIRRLQHFARCVLQETSSNHVSEHRANLWRKIRKASGFTPDFPSWWKARTVINFDAPQELPIDPPNPMQANAIFHEFHAEYAQYEKTLKKARYALAKTTRERDHLVIFKDLQKEQSEPVQTLVKENWVPITDGGNCENGIWLKLSQDFQLQDNLSFRIDGLSIQLQKVETAVFETSNMHNFDAIDDKRLLVTRLTGELSEMFEAFNAEWSSKWQREHPEPEAWRTIVDFAKCSLPTISCDFPPISLGQWKAAVKKKKLQSATGPDGISRSDLLALPDFLTCRLLEIIQNVESGASWPTQSMVGIVAALAKTPQAQKVSQYRPITILSMFYRVWASIRTRQCLEIISRLAPSSMQGSLPHKSSKQVWYHLQAVIEHTFANNQTAAGAVIDIVKCFNCLPREPLLEIGFHIGISPKVIRPWAAALTSVQRRFKIRGGVGPAVMSICGFPEGDPLSIIAMAIANLTLDKWISCRFPRIQTWTYVDNIETVCQDGDQAIQSLHALENFCEALDLQVDQTKTFCWTTDRDQRKQIKEQQVHTLKASRDLGGQMNYSKWDTKGVIKEKIDKFNSFWRRLARSSAPKFLKLRCLKVSAWPNIFHSISISSLGHVHFEKLRTQVMKALSYNTFGANPKLTLSCITPVASDPEFWCCFETVVSWKKYTIPEIADFVMNCIAQGEKMTPGPCSSLSRVLQKLGWTWVESGICLDADQLQIDLRNCPIQELFSRIKQAWQSAVLHECERLRKTMKGISKACVDTTTKDFETWNPSEQGILRCALNGTLYTHDALVHTGKVDTNVCMFCHSQDSSRHRHWECPHFDDIRKECLQSLVGDLQSFPDCLMLHGWLPKNPFVIQLKEALAAIPNTAHEHFVPDGLNSRTDVIDVFSDGSCICPTLPNQRVATWGVVVWHSGSFMCVAEGGVPGFHQTSLRAEIWAASASISFAVTQQTAIRLWTDNQAVFNFLQQLFEGDAPDLTSRKDADLWDWLTKQFDQARGLVTQIIKVKAHVDIATIDDVFEEWVYKGNNAADMAARRARNNLPQQLWWVWDQVVQFDHNNTVNRQAIHKFFVQVGLRAVQDKPLRQCAEPNGHTRNLQCQVDQRLFQLSTVDISCIPDHFKTDETTHVLSWLGTVASENAPARWVAWHQLLIDYQLFTGRAGPRNVGRRWRNVGYRPSDYKFCDYVRWFSHYIQNLGKAIDLQPEVKTMRPPSHVLTYWAGCVKVSISNERLEKIDSFLKRWATKVPARNLSRDLSEVPQASN